MAQILLRGIDDALVARLKDRARQNHCSPQSEVKAILEEAAPPMATRSEAVAISTSGSVTGKSRAIR